MSTFFDLEVSSNDSGSEQNFPLEENVESQINPYWFEVTDDEDDVERQVVLSRKEKTLRTIQTVCDTFEYNVDNASWVEAEKHYTDLCEKVEAYKKKFVSIPTLYLECLQNAPDLSEDLQNKARQDFENPKEFHSYKNLATMLKTHISTYATDIANLGKSEEDNEAEGESEKEETEMTEEDYAATLAELAVTKKTKSRVLQRIVSTCNEKGFTAMRITALALVASSTLDEDNHSTHVSLSTWRKGFQYANTCMSLVNSNPTITFADDFSTPLNCRRAAFTGGFSALLVKLYVHLLRITQFLDGRTQEYGEVPDCENRLAELTAISMSYFATRNHRRGIQSCCRILVDLLGPRPQAAHDLLFPQMKALPSGSIISSSVMETVQGLFNVLIKSPDEESRLRAILHMAYQMGLAGRYLEGRDLLQRAGIPDLVGRFVATSILYNRTVAQLGLSAFIAGNVAQAYSLLSGLWSKNTHAVLIGQSLPRGDKDVEEELKFRDLLIPPHQRMPEAHLELAAMLSTLVVDATKEAKNPYETSRHQNYFYRIVHVRDQPMIGPPLELREQVAAAYNALKTGDYQKAESFVREMSAWRSLPDGAAALSRYLPHLKDAALRIFCFTFRCSFSTFSVQQLALKFNMSECEVRGALSDIISDGTALIGYWDREDRYLHVDRNNTTRLQHAVVGTADSVASLAPFTESRLRANEGRGGRGRGRGRGGRGGGRR